MNLLSRFIVAIHHHAQLATIELQQCHCTLPSNIPSVVSHEDVEVLYFQQQLASQCFALNTDNQPYGSPLKTTLPSIKPSLSTLFSFSRKQLQQWRMVLQLAGRQKANWAAKLWLASAVEQRHSQQYSTTNTLQRCLVQSHKPIAGAHTTRWRGTEEWPFEMCNENKNHLQLVTSGPRGVWSMQWLLQILLKNTSLFFVFPRSVAFILVCTYLKVFFHPQETANKVRGAMKTDTIGERLQIEFHSECALFGISHHCFFFFLPNPCMLHPEDPLGTMRCCKVKFDEEVMGAKVSSYSETCLNRPPY